MASPIFSKIFKILSIPMSWIGIPNGVASLDETGKVPVDQLPMDGCLTYKGTWNASTNTPTLSNGGGGGVQCDYYVVSVAGTTSLDGISDWEIGDWVINNGSAWQKIDNTDLVQSVNGKTGTVVIYPADLEIQNLGTPTYDNLHQFINLISSAGSECDNAITDAGSAEIDVAAGSGFIRSTDACEGELFSFDWAASSGIAIPTDTTRFVGIEYNAGSPQVVVRTTNDFNGHDEFLLGSVVNEGDTLHIKNTPSVAFDAIRQIIHRFYETEPLKRAERLGGLIASGTGTRNIAVSAGELYDALNEYVISAIDTSGPDTFDYYYGSFTKVASQSQWDNLQYDNAGVLTTMTNNRWSVNWIYIETDGALVLIYGDDEYVSKAGAEAAPIPSSVPARLVEHGKLIGRLVFQKSAATADFESAFATTFTPSQATDHNNLAGLQGGTVNEYQHLTTAELARVTGLVINAQTGTSYTLVNADKGKLVTLNNASDIDLDVDTGLDSDFWCVIMQKGAGQVTIAGTATIHNADNADKTEKQWAKASIEHLGSDVFVTDGRLVS